MRESASIPKSADELDWESAKLLRRRLILLANWRGALRRARIERRAFLAYAIPLPQFRSGAVTVELLQWSPM